MDNYSSFIRQFRPELAPKTLSQYAKQLKYLSDAYGLDFNPLQLTLDIVDIALEELNVKHVTLVGLTYEKNLRLAVFRNLINIFNNYITPRDYEILDSLILEAKITK